MDKKNADSAIESLSALGLVKKIQRHRENGTKTSNSIAKVDPNAIGCGATVTKFMIDEQLMTNDEDKDEYTIVDGSGIRIKEMFT